MMILVTLFSVIGGCLVYKGATNGVKLVGYYFLQVQPAIFPHILSMVASNFRGTTRRSIASSAVFIVYCVANIAGPQLFRHEDAPKYTKAFLSWIICYCLTILFAVLIMLSYKYQNKRQAAKQQVKPEEDPNADLVEYVDPTFRYMY
ncbi:unnamed protein product [Ambrosiozyma monospora]|uniref:Unnamed protein product n=1 Tax=Ambrosiozyma monospora TaxID=43982 RepID=A0ACB5TD35_AMBMO|nr:unnamed protein product [Ambrosiozyma monospora]